MIKLVSSIFAVLVGSASGSTAMQVTAPSRDAAPPAAIVRAAPSTVPAPAIRSQAVIQNPSAGFEAYKRYLAGLAMREGVRTATAQAYVPSLQLNSRAIALDQAQRPVPAIPNAAAAPPPLSPYLRDHVTPSLITRGQARYYQQWPNLVRVYSKFGVDPAVAMAIYGKETSYGGVTGGFDLLDVLASLAYEGRRREMFETEFVAALKLIDGGLPRDRLRGSYAGATGYPQFMPSVVLRLRADGDNDGYADIWANEADALASISNYLHDAGWKPGVAWGSIAALPANLNRASLVSTRVEEKCPAVFKRHSREMTVGEWKALGVAPIRPLPEHEPAVLFEPDGPGSTAYLLTRNYRAILAYNCSNFYAMSVALLSDGIARR